MPKKLTEKLWNPWDRHPNSKKKRKHRTPTNDRESAVLKECLQFLNGHENVVYVERRNTGAVKFVDGFFMRFGSPGAADIWCIIDCDISYNDYAGPMGPTHVEIECKRRDGKGRLSEDQKTFKRMCNKSGIPYFVVTSAEDLKEQLQSAGLLEV